MSTKMTTDPLLNTLSSKDFDPRSYVRGVTVNSIGVDELLKERERIQKLNEETSVLLKKNVYKNYTQFIDTAKEISYLESEMYQLSHMLTEQQNVLNSVLDVAIAAGKSVDPLETSIEVEEDSKRKVTSLLEQVEGCAPVLEQRGRSVVHCGELIELNAMDYRCLQKLYCILLNDGFIIAEKCKKKWGPIQYQFEIVYELDSLAVVDLDDDANVKYAFKILVFPDSRMFQCTSPNIKSEWLNVIELAKKKRMSVFRRKSSLMLDYQNPFEEDKDGDNPFEDDDQENEASLIEKERELEMPNWLVELPEDLDVCIAQREFEQAVNLVHKANQHFANYPKSIVVKDMKVKVDSRIKHLIEILKNELKISPERSIHGGPRVARRAVTVLLSLGKSSIATDLFLKHRSAILRQSLKQQTMGGATPPYIEQLCSVFFGGIIEAGQEFMKAFEVNNGCASSFVIWAKKQLQNFIQIFSRHVFTPQVTPSVSAECISYSRIHSNRLPEIGLDLSFELNALLQAYVERLITEMRDKLLEAIKLRGNDDKWRPQNFQNTNNLRKFMDDIGIEDMDSYNDYWSYDECWISLTANTTAFGKMYLNFVDDLLKLYTPTVHILVNDALYVSFQSQIAHIASNFQVTSEPSEKQFISKNALFLSECILPLACKNYLGKLGLMFPRMAELRAELGKYYSSGKPPISKYSSTVFV